MTAGRVRAFAPGSIGNVGPGFDILGLAVAGWGDTVTATRADRAGVAVTDPGLPELPTDPERHTSGIAATEVLRLAGAERCGVSLAVEKGLPLSGGAGGSAASAVAAAVAVNALFGLGLDTDRLLEACLAAEERVAGRHADNLASALLGGLVLVRSVDPLDVVRLPVPADLRIVLAHPAQRLTTAESRAVLPSTVPRALAMRQAAQVAALVAALAAADWALLARAVDDFIAEPARAPLLPGFVDAKRAALDAGALGASISGAGPTAFAFVRSVEDGDRVARAMRDAYQRAGVACRARVADVDRVGARVVERG
jgi:homoserine kinase